jgi:Domain of unknown function (DUF4287)
MGQTPDEMLSAVSASLAVRTGRSLDEWVALVQAHDIDPIDQNAVRRWLRSEHGVAQNSQWAIADAAARAAGWVPASAAAGLENEEEPAGPAPLPAPEALELLALSEVIARKAGYGRQLTVRSARVAGASWSQIGAALGTSKQSAWEAHSRWIDQQAEQHGRIGYEGMDDQQAAAARALAGTADEERSA